MLSKKLHWFLKAPSILIFLQHKKFFANNKGTAGIGAPLVAEGYERIAKGGKPLAKESAAKKILQLWHVGLGHVP